MFSEIKNFNINNRSLIQNGVFCPIYDQSVNINENDNPFSYPLQLSPILTLSDPPEHLQNPLSTRVSKILIGNPVDPQKLLTNWEFDFKQVVFSTAERIFSQEARVVPLELQGFSKRYPYSSELAFIYSTYLLAKQETIEEFKNRVSYLFDTSKGHLQINKTRSVVQITTEPMHKLD